MKNKLKHSSMATALTSTSLSVRGCVGSRWMLKVGSDGIPAELGRKASTLPVLGLGLLLLLLGGIELL